MLLVSALLAASVLALYMYADGQRLSPDGRVYLLAAGGLPVPRPSHLRPLLPWLLGQRVWAWRAASFAGLVVAAVFVAAIAQTQVADGRRSLFAAALFVGLPIARTTTHLPVLVDGPALAFTAGSAYLAAIGHGPEAALIALVGAGVKEHVPIFAALAAMSPWPLVGLAVPAALWLFRTPAVAEHPSVARPFSYAREKQAPRMLDVAKMVLPWGACLAVLASPTTAVVASVAAGYALLFVAADSARVFQWAAIPVCVAAALALPDGYLLPAAVAHLFNPWKGDL